MSETYNLEANPFQAALVRMAETQLTADAAGMVLNYFRGVEGQPAGAFFAHLMRAFAHADEHNFARLREAFPDVGAAMWLAQYSPEGIDLLRLHAEDSSVS